MTDKIKPLSNRVVVKPKEAEEKTQGGIYIPTQSEEKVVTAEVVATGPGKLVDGKLEPVSVEKKQVVVFNQFSGTEIELDGSKYMVVREDDILAVIA
ncbi:MAG: co-chaperone GroES [Pseudomonadota bacterium]|nr:co-chaperone GroES [Pseudomonadota bacterium]